MKAYEHYSEGEGPKTYAESVFIRPRMYTVNGTLEEAGAFLQGFYSGAVRGNFGWTEAERWSDYCRWACDRLEIQSGWTQLFSEMRRSSADDDEGFAKLTELYIQFRKEREGA